MSLGADLDLPPYADPEPCAFGKFIRDSDERVKLEEAVDKIRIQREANPHQPGGYTSAWLGRVLLKNGIPHYSKDQIQRHVRGECACSRIDHVS